MRQPHSALLGLRVPALVLAVALGGACSEPPAHSTLLVTIDTLRADALGAYGGPATPHFDRLASESALFERALAPMPLTRPSHFTLLTSLHPREHGVLNNAQTLPEGVATLAEPLQREGVRTAAFTGVQLLSPESGAGRGFMLFDHPHAATQRVAEQVVPRSLAWLAQLEPDERFFLWVHLFDPHIPYAPPRDPQLGHVGDPGAGPRGLDWIKLMAAARANGGDLPERTLERARRLYQGEVAYTDHWLGRLVDGVAMLRPLDRVLVVVTADHGECFEDGVWFEHSHCLHQSALRVPLLVRLPGRFPPGRRDEAWVDLADVAPTILAAMGAPVPEGFRGRPLQERRDGPRASLVQDPVEPADWRVQVAPRSVIHSVGGEARTPEDRTPRVGVVEGDWKLLRGTEGETLVPVEPGADRRGAVDPPEGTAERLRAALDRELVAHPMRFERNVELDEETRDVLEALGYLEPSPGGDAPSAEP